MKRSFLTKFVPLGLLFLLLALLMPRNSKFAYDYRKGREWKYETLFAEEICFLSNCFSTIPKVR